MKVLIIQHIQEKYKDEIEKNYPDGWNAYLAKLTEVAHSGYDKIIVNLVGTSEPEEIHKSLPSHTQYYQWDFGWNSLNSSDPHYFIEEVDSTPKDVEIPNIHILEHETIDDIDYYVNQFDCYIDSQDGQTLLVPKWLAELIHDHNRIDICGAFDFECVTDLENVLGFFLLTYNRREALIVGRGNNEISKDAIEGIIRFRYGPCW